MSLNDELKAKKAELAALKDRIEANDAEAITAGEKLKEEIEAKTAEIQQAEKKVSLLNVIGKKESEDTTMSEVITARTLGENFVETLKKTGKTYDRGEKFRVTAPVFAKAATDIQTTPAGITEYATTFDRNVVTAPRVDLVVRDLFGTETISGSTLMYLVEGAQEGEPAITAEGATKAQVHFGDPTPKTVSLDKITEYIKESEEYINDYAFLASAINGRLLYALGLTEQNYLVTKLLGTSGIQTGTITGTTAAEKADEILAASRDVRLASGFAADAILINPADWYTFLIGKDGTNRYYGGGYFGAQNTPNMWGIPVCESTAVAQGTIVVGAFKTCASVVHNGGVRVESTNTNEDDFIKNLMTIRAEERLALAVRRPAGFKKLTL